MRIKDLIEMLKKHDPELLVVGRGLGEGGYSEIHRIEEIEIIDNPCKGNHSPDYILTKDRNNFIVALFMDPQN